MADRVTLEVRAVARDERRFNNNSDARTRFWRAIEEKTSPSEREERLKQNFGPALARKVASHLHQMWGTHIDQMPPERFRIVGPFGRAMERRMDALSGVFFTFRLRGYSSLDFSVEIIGLRSLAQLIDNNFDVFMAMMSAYIPASFREAISFYGDADAISFELMPDEELRSAFEHAPARASSRGGSASSPRDAALWLLTNTTLLLPVLLALAICYVTYKGLAEERAAMTAHVDRLLTHQEAFIKQNNERLQAMRKIEEQLIERAMQPVSQNTPPQTGATTQQQTPTK